jgi:hypothetical protein
LVPAIRDGHEIAQEFQQQPLLLWRPGRIVAS